MLSRVAFVYWHRFEVYRLLGYRLEKDVVRWYLFKSSQIFIVTLYNTYR